MNKRIGAKSIAEIKKEFETADRTERKKLQMLYTSDERSGVKNLIHRYLREEEKLLAEEERTEAMKCYERQYEHVGWICGIDEVGRGPLAGPVVAGAVILPKDCHIRISMIRKSCLPGSGRIIRDHYERSGSGWNRYGISCKN